MIKVFIFNGSLHKISNTNEVLKMFESNLKEFDTLDIYEYSDGIESCLGCRNCFLGANCPLNIQNSLDEAIVKMMESDLVIFATPVYLNNVSGRIKNFLDRLAYLTHYMALSGKVGVTIATTDGTGADYANKYLKLIQTHLGLNVVASMGIKSYMIYNKRKEVNTALDKIAMECVNSMKKQIYTNTDLEAIFKEYKSIMGNSQLNSFESNFWKSSGLINCGTFSELCDVDRVIGEYIR